MAPRRKPSPQCAVLLAHLWQFSKTKIPSVDVTTHPPVLPWTIRHADTPLTPYEKIRGQKYREEVLPLGKQVRARRPRASVNQLLQPWVTGLWLARDSLSDEHLGGTAAGVMRSRAVSRLQEPTIGARSFANNAHLGRHISISRVALVCTDQFSRSLLRQERHQDSSRLQQPQPHRNRKFVTTTSDADQSTKRQHKEVIPRESQPASSSSCAAADTSMQIPDSQIPNLHVNCHPPSGKTVSKKSQGTIGSEHSVDDGKSLQPKRDCNTDRCSESVAHSKTERASQRGPVWCGGRSRQATITTSSVDTLGTKTTAGRILQNANCGKRIRVDCQSCCSFFLQQRQAQDFARTSHDRCNPWKSSCFRDCHSAFHHSPVPSESEPVYVEPAPETQLDSSKVWLCKSAIQRLKISPQARGIHSTQQNRRRELQPADFRSFDVREETYTTIR